ncbi:Crp/Fnr family transcriptional regulator [Sphingomonas sp. RS6]
MATLTPREAEVLRTFGEGAVRYRRNAIIRRDSAAVSSIYVILQGWAASSIRLQHGLRQIVKIHIAGDIMGTPSMALETAADTLTALTECLVAEVSLDRLRELFVAHPRLPSLFLMAVQVERIALMDVVASVGKSSARERLARLILDLHDRLSKIGAVTDGTFEMPLTQEQLGDVLGLTSVHVNRTMRLMEREGLIVRQGTRLSLPRLDQLRRLSPLPPRRIRFDPAWLPAPES